MGRGNIWGMEGMGIEMGFVGQVVGVRFEAVMGVSAWTRALK